MPTGSTFITCASCRFWSHTEPMDGFCRRHAPATGDQGYQVARWPETRAADGCGDGERADASAPEPQICRTCAFWHRPGIGIDPAQRGDHLSGWWREAGLCRRHAPRPAVEIGYHAFWRATHASDRCFDGRPA